MDSQSQRISKRKRENKDTWRHKKVKRLKKQHTNMITLRSGKQIEPQFINITSFTNLLKREYNTDSNIEQEFNSLSESKMVDKIGTIIGYRQIKANGHSDAQEKASTKQNSLNNSFSAMNVSASAFDSDGKLCNAIKAKLKANYPNNSIYFGSEEKTAMQSITACSSDPYVCPRINGYSPFIVDVNKSDLKVVPNIFCDDHKDHTNNDFSVKHDNVRSVVTLFSDSTNVKGQVEVVEWDDKLTPLSNNHQPFSEKDNQNSSGGCFHGNQEKFSEYNGCDYNNVKQHKQSMKEQNIDDSKTANRKDSDHATLFNDENIHANVSAATLNNSLMSVDHLVYVGSDFCLITIKHPCKLYFYGKLRVSCLYGNIEVLGYRLNDQYHDVYSTRPGGALCFESFPVDDSCYGLFMKLRNIGVSIAKTEEIVTTMKSNDGILVLKPLKNKLVDFIGKHFRTFDPFSKKGLTTNPLFFELEQKVKCNLFFEPPKHFFSRSSQWQEITSNIKGVAIIAGGKNAGKSTFLRYYVNKALFSQHSIAVIDLDPGQPEFTVAASLSVTVVQNPLLGPNFTHLREPTRMYNIGTINVMENLERYMSAVKELFDYCKTDSKIKDLPWVVNTMGMTDETGLQLITYIIMVFKPNTVVELENKNRFSISLQPNNVHQLWVDNCTNPIFANVYQESDEFDYKHYYLAREESSNKDSVSSLPKHQRFLNILAYFSQMISNSSIDLIATTPFVASLDKIKIVVSSHIRDTNLYGVINGKLVALCSSTAYMETCPKVNLLKESFATCFGYGLIRGIDAERKLIYIITPVKKELMHNVDVLLFLEALPDLCSLNETSFDRCTKLPFSSLLSTGFEQRLLLKTPERRFNLLQLLKMKSAAGAT